MRLFAAVLPPAWALEELGAAVDPLRRLPDAGRLRWTERAGWHVVLAFYGEVPEERLPGLCRRLGLAARRHPPHELRLAGGGRFAERVLWAGLGGDLARLARLAASAAAAGRRAGAEVPEERTYRPHLTLARPRRGWRGGLDRYAARLADFAGGPWPLSEFTLLRSLPPAPGVPGAQPRYEPLATCPLTGTG
ncbi:RNA 2',3'-cyclic phosphodiesterase [Streptomyces hoynatensis]|uniref:RNA 2',3'-cyclic phosphodiesterase n=1 Tax=Streptomyces hoynatensis TaxID=1141874 RepID=A0A3A9Z757_9ACTN|nr:RNA 2',3'-cyclic phosphodiesterase [Streptomyces hoynatensis]RKN43879.1 RNA 2',3'-cyclic phosphodiesterase [Streptomyces hoynatensis]